MDPHKRSATIEVMTAEETILGGGRFATDRDGYDEMRRYASRWPERVWAIEGCAGIGKHIAMNAPNTRLGQICRPPDTVNGPVKAASGPVSR